MATRGKKATGFYVMTTGQIDSCKMSGSNHLYCKYAFVKGKDWEYVNGLDNGISQIAQTMGEEQIFSWNYPLDITFRSTNVHGWPQIVISVYGINVFGKDVIRGYGSTFVPTTPGRHVRYVRLYTPVSSSICRRLTSWLASNPPEFFDSTFIAQGKGREVTRVESNGSVKVVFNVMTKNMRDWGYTIVGERGPLVDRTGAALNAVLLKGGNKTSKSGPWSQGVDGADSDDENQDAGNTALRRRRTGSQTSQSLGGGGGDKTSSSSNKSAAVPQSQMMELLQDPTAAKRIANMRARIRGGGNPANALTSKERAAAAAQGQGGGGGGGDGDGDEEQQALLSGR